jgi:hypothetical protein
LIYNDQKHERTDTMPGTTTTSEAGRKVAQERPLISTGAEKVLNDAQRRRNEAAARSAAALNAPQDAPLFDDAPPPAAPLTLNAIHAKLCKPFAAALVELKPGATTQDKSRALCMPFVDSRAYQTRLDRVVGPEGWSVEYRPLSDRAVLCRLTILGVTREDVGECNQADENAATSAVAQSFKRACSAFGLGRYLYSLPGVWADYNAQKKQVIDPAGVVAQMYASLPKED